MNKLLILTILSLIFSSGVLAQKRPEKYCLLNISYTAQRVVVKADPGNDSLLSIKNSGLLDDLKRLNTSRYKSTVDVLNYMSSKGWALVATTVHFDGNTWEFYFKRGEDE